MTSLLLPQLLRGENDSKQSDEFQAMIIGHWIIAGVGRGLKIKQNGGNLHN